MKVISILIILTCYSSCISKSEKNKSVIQGYWERESSQDDKRFSLLYFRGNHAIVRGYESVDVEFAIYDEFLNLSLSMPYHKNHFDKIKLEIISLSYNRLTLLLNEDTLVYNRKLKINSEEPVSFNLANSGLQDLEMEVTSDLQCKSRNMDNSMINTIKILDIPEWKWLALREITSSMVLKSFKSYDDTPLVCGGEFALIVETDKGIYQYCGIDNHTNVNELEFLAESIWQVGCSTATGGTKEKGQLKFHKELIGLFPQIEEMKVLQFVPPIK